MEQSTEIEGEWLTLADMKKLEFPECLGVVNKTHDKIRVF